jgi:hypothetical protein
VNVIPVKVDELINNAEARAEAEEVEEEVSYRTSMSASIRSESVGGTSTGTAATGGTTSRPISQTVDNGGEESKNRVSGALCCIYMAVIISHFLIHRVPNFCIQKDHLKIENICLQHDLNMILMSNWNRWR